MQRVRHQGVAGVLFVNEGLSHHDGLVREIGNGENHLEGALPWLRTARALERDYDVVMVDARGPWRAGM